MIAKRLILIFLIPLFGFCQKSKNNDDLLILLALFSTAQLPNSGVNLCTGPANGTYSKTGQALDQGFQDSNRKTLNLISTNGTLENSTKLLNDECKLAIVQEDIFLHIADNSSESSSLKLSGMMEILLPLHREPVHVLVNKSSSINSIADFSGKTINLGPQNSGTYLTAQQLLKGRGLTFTERNDPPEVAVDKVANGEYDGTFYVAAAPIAALSALPSTANVKLIQATLNPGSTNDWYEADGRIESGIYSWHTTTLENNIFVRSLLVKSVSFNDISVNEFLDANFDNASGFASRFTQSFQEVNRKNAEVVFKKLPLAWNYDAVLNIKNIPPPGLFQSNFCAGAAGGTYDAIADDLIPVIEAAMGLKLSKKNTTGSIENAVGLFDGTCSFALVQEDTSSYLANHPSKLYNVASQAHRSILPLYYEDVLFLVKTGGGDPITSFTKDALKNKTINLGQKTSGTYATAVSFLAQLNLNPTDNVEFTYESASRGNELVVEGTNDASFQVIAQAQSNLSTDTGKFPDGASIKFQLIQASGTRFGNYNNGGTILNANFRNWHNADLANNARVRAVFAFPTRGIADTNIRNLMEEIYRRQGTGDLPGARWTGITKASAITHFRSSKFGTAGYHPKSVEYYLEDIQTSSRAFHSEGGIHR
ncbi:MAG: TAXI family TRAP transporter solute-binding subunit [Leptospira sp.]|nr:TAXI family TRAP transporter solute-binding subunit [Leptospira sp.]